MFCTVYPVVDIMQSTATKISFSRTSCKLYVCGMYMVGGLLVGKHPRNEATRIELIL